MRRKDIHTYSSMNALGIDTATPYSTPRGFMKEV